MEDSLSKKTRNSILWNGLDKVGFQVVALIVTLVTARMLTPYDFGLIGALAIFTALSNILVESGFSSAMIRRKGNSDAEYMSVLAFNVLISIIAYAILYINAPIIADYYNKVELIDLSRFLFLSIIFNSFSIVQTIILSQKMEFKILSKANLISAFLSGVITIIMLYLDFGYKAIAWQIILQNAIKSLSLWIMSSWRPVNKFDFRVIKELFSFSFSLIIANTMITIIRYIYNLVIGRNYSMEHLGHYSQASKYHQIPTNVISSTINGVAYPVLSKLNDDEPRQLTYFRKLIRVTAFCIFPVMLGLDAAFDNIVEIVLTSKWLPIVPYFRILSIASIFIPFHSLNVSLCTLKGYPRKNFMIEVIRNTIIVISILFFFNKIEWMLIFFSASYVVSFLIGAYFSGNILPYKVLEQIYDIAPYAVISTVMAALVFFIPILTDWNIYMTTIVQITVGVSFYIAMLKILGSTVFNDITAMIQSKMH